MPKLIVDAVDPAETGVANGMNTVIRTIGGVVGAQVGAVFLATHGVAGTAVPGESGFVLAFWVSAIGAVVGAVAAALVFPGRPWARALAAPAALVRRLAPGRS